MPPEPSKTAYKRRKRGRPTLDMAEGLKRHSVVLDAHTVAVALDAGRGNLSLGLRIIASEYVEAREHESQP